MICVSLGNISVQQFQNVVNNNELVELRIDLLSEDNIQNCENYFIAPKKTIITGRLSKIKSSSIPGIIEIVESAVKNNVAFIDIDINDLDYFVNVIKLLSSSTTKLILSYHNNDCTPDNNEISRLIDQMSEYNPDIYKLCFKANTIDDIIRTLSIYQNHNQKSIVAFNLGEKGTISRLLAKQIGSPLIYVAVDEQNKIEPSQITIDEFHKFRKILML